MIQLIVIGANHRFAPLAWRERLALTRDALVSALRALHRDLPQIAILATCNRVEFYAGTDDLARAQRTITNWLRDCFAIGGSEFDDYFYAHQGEAAVRHLMTVAAGLDSMLIGEAQILGQVGAARDIAQQAETLGAELSRLFLDAVTVGKAARTRTEIGRGALSLGYAAVELARAIFTTNPPQQVLVIGAGEMAESVARCLAANGIGPILVANRTFERAAELAEKFGGRAIHFGSIPDALAQVDIVIASSAAPHVVVDREAVARAAHARRGRPLFLIDIAVPRDIDPTAAELEGVRLYNLDDLREVCDANLVRRQGEADKVRVMVEDATRQFARWLAERASAPTIGALYQKAEMLRQAELGRARRRLGDLSPEQSEVLDTLTRALVHKLLREPVLHLKRPNNGWAQSDYVAMTRALFGLDQV